VAQTCAASLQTQHVRPSRRPRPATCTARLTHKLRPDNLSHPYHRPNHPNHHPVLGLEIRRNPAPPFQARAGPTTTRDWRNIA
jgi:hypothetical protein